MPLPSPTVEASESGGGEIRFCDNGVWLRRLFIGAVSLVLAIGIGVRVVPWAGFEKTGFDAALYHDYVLGLEQRGLSGYREICAEHVKDQAEPESICKLPPTRFLYIACSWAWHRVFHGVPTDAMSVRVILLESVEAPPETFSRQDAVFRSLRQVSCFFTTLLFVMSGVFVWRSLGRGYALGVWALMACAPTQIHMAQHALIDGVLAFWATLGLWMLWETMQHPEQKRWLIGYGVALFGMVLTKENSAFVYTAFVCLIALNRWARFGVVGARLCWVTMLAPAMAVAALMALAGGLGNFVEIYQVLVRKASSLEYAIMTGDGPWYRYLVDLMVVSPWVLCLAIGSVFGGAKENRLLIYLAAFVGFSYLIMCNVQYGMNLRYAVIWEVSLCSLAVAQVYSLTRQLGCYQLPVACVLITALGAYSLRQYSLFFVDARLLELVSEGLFRAVNILKGP